MFTGSKVKDNLTRLESYHTSMAIALSKTKKGKNWNKNYLMMDWDHQSNKKVDWLFGACLIIRKSAIDEIGLLDERYFLYMEDLDWCRRFWNKKCAVCCNR